MSIITMVEDLWLVNWQKKGEKDINKMAPQQRSKYFAVNKYKFRSKI